MTNRSAIAASFALLFATTANGQTLAAKTLHLVLVTPVSGERQYYSSGDSDTAALNRALSRFRKGVVLGAEEADRTGRLLGWTVRLTTVNSTKAAAASDGTGKVIFSAMPLPVSPQRQRVMVSGFGPTSGKTCAGRPFIISSTRFDSSSSLWDSTAERFGAAQLNDRFRLRFHEGMDTNAWAGWVAVKVVSEAVFRTGSSRPVDIRKYFTDPTTRFDGHKGVPLHFSQDRILVSDPGDSPRTQCE